MEIRKTRGFTLIELLVSIAIIGVLAGLVVVMINPAERLRESADQRAASNVRAVGLAVQTCETTELRFGAAGFAHGPKGFSNPHIIVDTSDITEAGCGNFTWMSAAGRVYSTTLRSQPPNITVWNNGSLNPTRVCLWAPGGNTGGVNNWWVYSTSRPEARSVTTDPMSLGAGAGSCLLEFDSL